MPAKKGRNAEPRKIILIDDNLKTTWCSQGHDMREIELEYVGERHVNAGNCPECVRRYVSVVRQAANDL